ncbi:MobV family relaxase [Myroides odoratimimus]|uniref:MobV family relaxase n=1 Tax=Myroides odoratimimus TaxID=76832 RepID=UPI002576252B|nr:MobV family relaxase [Myroides odoratimimus]MDM1036340.1 plasmid recombination protein [Myroides odoratimimus]MDM1039870.1 plasmid recombination protein [Myroides odoratimimus]MDM1054103.1 plasmid recombination protein [Myroides odoratimimus]
MGKQYAVIHVEKGKGSGAALGHHIDRTKGKEYSYQHSDPTLKHLNSYFKLNAYCSMSLQEAVKARIKDGYTSKRKINDNAVTHLKIVLTGSHERMKELEANGQGLKEWVMENKKFLEEKYGSDNIVRFTLHRDEKTPHLHAVVVPLTADGRLSAFEVLGNKIKMKALQNDYAKAMASFGLERGMESTGIKHEDVKAYYSRIEKANEVANNTEINVSKNFLGNYKSESVEELKESLKSLKSALKAKESILQSEEKKKIAMSERLDKYQENNTILKNNIQTLIVDDAVREREQEKALKKLQEEIQKAFDRELQRTRGLHLLDTAEKIHQFVSDKVSTIAANIKTSSNLMDKCFSDLSFVQKLINKATERVNRALQRDNSQDEKQERNRGMRL